MQRKVPLHRKGHTRVLESLEIAPWRVSPRPTSEYDEVSVDNVEASEADSKRIVSTKVGFGQSESGSRRCRIGSN